MKITYYFSLLFLVFTVSGYTQISLSGEVRDSYGDVLIKADVSLRPLNELRLTDSRGFFRFKTVASGTYTLTVTHVGFKTYRTALTLAKDDVFIKVRLEEDLLNLQDVVVTGTFDPRIQLESNTAITTLNSKALQKVFPRGTAEMLQAIPGTFVDPAAGEVFTKVYSRGISAAAEDDIGWYYVSLQEDGLPVSLVQHSYYGPDLFHRLDLTTKKVEGIRGGSAAITQMNAPGGVYNFISHGRREYFSGAFEYTTGIQGEGNPYFKIDGSWGGPLGNNWFFNFGGHYRVDEGARNTDFIFSKGGQLKFDISKRNKNGHFKFYGKILDDFTNRYTGVAAMDWDDSQAAFGQDFSTTSLMMPAFNAAIPDGRSLEEGITNDFDPSQGVHAQDRAFGMDIQQNLGGDWSLDSAVKFSNKDANWQTSISNAFVSLNNPLAYFISGADFPIGQVVFRDARSGDEVARIDNSGILAGESFQYVTEGRLPNDAIQGTSTWYKDNRANEWMGQLRLRKQANYHDINFGVAGGFSNTSVYTQASFAYVTYAPDPQLLQVTLENPNQPVIALSDENGVSNYGGLLYINANARVRQLATFANDRWKITDKLQLDLGLRLETIAHRGGKDRFAPSAAEGGVDGDATTVFDSGVLSPTGEQDDFDFTYSYISHSIGLNYRFEEKAAAFARYSKGNKAPELNYYFNNFSNVPINQEGEVQRINQLELGLKWYFKNFSFTSTAFWSRLSNIGITNFEFDAENNTIFYSPVQFNTSRTIGLEWDSVYTPFRNIVFTFSGTIQDPIATEWTVFDAAGTVDTTDDSIQDFSGETLPFNPKIMFNLGTEYQTNGISAFVKWQFMGEREGNVANAVQLGSYSIFNGGIGYNLSKQWSIDLLATNILNSEGLANFFGPNSFGANANNATSQFIQDNPDASFVVVPVLPRGVLLKLGYRF